MRPMPSAGCTAAARWACRVGGPPPCLSRSSRVPEVRRFQCDSYSRSLRMARGSGLLPCGCAGPAGRFAVAVIFVSAALALFTASPAGAAPGALRAQHRRRLAAAQLAAPAGDDVLWPRSATIRGLETLWELPPSPTRILFVAHGCNHGAEDWFDPGPACPACLGLPEERLVRLAALRRGYAVVAVSSHDRDTKCWHNTAASQSEDLQRLPSVLREVMREEGLDGLPLYAFGASSGGGIVLRLAALMLEVEGVIAQVVPARPSHLDTPAGHRMPPVLFAHMAQRQPDWAEEVARTLQYCRVEGIPAAEIRIRPLPVTARFLRRSPLVGAAAAVAMASALRAEGLLSEAGFLLEDPRKHAQRWQAALAPVAGDLVGRSPGREHLTELLNVAYARHELTGSTAEASLAWLEGGGRDALVEEAL